MSIRTLTNLDLSNKSLKDSDNIFQELVLITELRELDLSNNELTCIAEDLSALDKLQIINLTNNPFIDFEKVCMSLSTLPNLADLKINIADQNEAIMVLSYLPSLEFLNGKTTQDQEESQQVDIEETEAQSYSLNSEIQNFNNIFSRIERLSRNPSLKGEFHHILTSEVDKINSSVEREVPNYYYGANLLNSKINIYTFFHKKAVALIERKEVEAARIISDTFNFIEDSSRAMHGLLLKIEDRVRRNDDENKGRIHSASIKIEDQDRRIKELEKLLNESENEKEFRIQQYDEEVKILFEKIRVLDTENQKMTQNILTKAKSEGENYIIIPKKDTVMNRESVLFSDLSSVNVSKSGMIKSNVSVGPIGSRVLTKKMLLEIIDEIYSSKENFDKKCDETRQPRETMEAHMYTYLNQKYGLKNLIIEWATSIINGIRMFSPEDASILMFGKILRNEIEEDSRLVIDKLKSTIPEILSLLLKSKFPLKSNSDIKEMTLNRLHGMLSEEEWKKIISYLYEKNEAVVLDNKINEFIRRKSLDIEKTEGGKKRLTREEIHNLSKSRIEGRILFSDFFKVVLDHNIRVRDKYLRNFCVLFKSVDTDSNGTINEDEFLILLSKMEIYPEESFEENADRLLNKVDQFNNKQINFSDLVILFANEDSEDFDRESKSRYSILDKVSLNKDIL